MEEKFRKSSCTTRKVCSYKDCDSDNANINCKETFFKFPPPEDSQKFQQWVRLSNCNVDNLEIPFFCYLCSKHFDKKYISTNPRRKMLLSSAVPIAYKTTTTTEEQTNENSDVLEYISPEDETNSSSSYPEILLTEQNQKDSPTLLDIIYVSDEGYEISTRSSKQGILKRKRSSNEESSSSKTYLIESTIKSESKEQDSIEQDHIEFDINEDDEDYGQQNIVAVVDNAYIDDGAHEISTTSKQQQSLIKKRPHKEEKIKFKKNDNQIPRTYMAESSSLAFATNKQIIRQDSSDIDSIEDEDNDDALLTNENISILRVKNEEYVQMPKSFYCNEKRELLKQLQSYKNVIRNLKKQILSVEL